MCAHIFYEMVKVMSDIVKITICAFPWSFACDLSAVSASCGVVIPCVLGSIAH